MKIRLMTILAATVMGLSVIYPGMVHAEETADIQPLVPQSYQQAEDFINAYGTSRVVADQIITVFQEYKSSVYSYTVGSDTCPVSELGNSRPTVVIPCAESYHEVFDVLESPYQYEVVAFTPPKETQVTVTLTRWNQNVPYNDHRFCFVSDAEGFATQTDMYGWLPDSYGEYNEYVRNYGDVSVHDEYIIYCGKESSSTGSTIQMEQHGTAQIEEVLEQRCSYIETNAWDGNSAPVIKVYKAVTDGTVEITWTTGREWDKSAPPEKTDTRTFSVSEDGKHIQDVTGVYTATDVPGDVNADGTFSVLDVVTLQKWLCPAADAKQTTALSDWQAGDLNGDGILDILDLALMKHKLTARVEDAFHLLAVNDMSMDQDAHAEWTGKILRSAEEAAAEMAVSLTDDDADITPPKDSFFERYVLVVLYSPARAGNQYSMINRIYPENGAVHVETLTEIPEIATPDMMYRQYAYAVDRSALEGIDEFVFSDHPTTYSYEQSNDAQTLYKVWCQQTVAFAPPSPEIVEDGFIAVFHGNYNGLVYETYVYNSPYDSDNNGYLLTHTASLPGHTDDPVVLGSQFVEWTDDVFTNAEKNHAYDYVSVPDATVVYTIEEFRELFLKN